MFFHTKFGVPWLDKSFCMAMEDEVLVRMLTSVSDQLGPLVRGSYRGEAGQMALIRLLGPAFVCKHLRDDMNVNKYVRQTERDQTNKHLEDEKGNWAIVSNIKKDLESLSKIAQEKSWTDTDIKIVTENVRNIIKNNFEIASSSNGYLGNNGRLNDSNNSFKSFQNEDRESECLETLIGFSLLAMSEFDRKENCNQSLQYKTKITFEKNLLGLPKDLRWQIWIQSLPVNSIAQKSQGDAPVKSINSTSKPVLEEFKCCPVLKSFDDINGNCQLLSIKILSKMSKFKRCNLYWMIPLLHASSDNMFIKIDDNDYHLEIIDKLQYVLSNFKLKNQDIFTLVDSVLETIQRFDQDYRCTKVCNDVVWCI